MSAAIVLQALTTTITDVFQGCQFVMRLRDRPPRERTSTKDR